MQRCFYRAFLHILKIVEIKEAVLAKNVRTPVCPHVSSFYPSNRSGPNLQGWFFHLSDLGIQQFYPHPKISSPFLVINPTGFMVLVLKGSVFVFNFPFFYRLGPFFCKLLRKSA